MKLFDLKQLEYLKYIRNVKGVFIILVTLVMIYFIVNKPKFKSQTEIQFDQHKDSIK